MSQFWIDILVSAYNHLLARNSHKISLILLARSTHITSLLAYIPTLMNLHQEKNIAPVLNKEDKLLIKQYMFILKLGENVVTTKSGASSHKLVIGRWNAQAFSIWYS